MGRYTWHATDERGRAQRGECTAPGLAEAADQVRAKGLAPLSLDRLDPESLLQPSTTADAFTLFNRNLAQMTAVGLPLQQAVREIASGLRRGKFRRGLEQVEASLREGKPLEEALGEVKGVFPPYYRWMVQAGVSSGNLSVMLSAVARNTEGILVARRAFWEALLYPFLILLVAFLLGSLTLLVFVPFYRQLSTVQGFEATGLPFFLRSLDTAAAIGAIPAGLVLLAVGLSWFLRRTAIGDRILQSVPLVGRIRRHLMMARLLGALGVLLRASVPLDRALPVALGAAGSLDLDRAADSVIARASEGRSLGEVLAGAPGVSAEVSQFLEVAVRTGDAPQAAMQVADLLTEQALSESEALFVVLVPAALLVAGAVVGGLLMLVVLPYVRFLESMCR